jgi:RNA polymerase sigma-70 factor (ECF subfamily)
LLELLRKGKQDEGFALLYEDHRADVERYVRVRISDPARRQDVAQEIWTAVHTSLPRFEGRSKARTWLLAIAHHKLTKAYGTTSFSTLDSVAEVGPLVARPPTPTQELDRAARAQVLHRLLAGLTAEERDVLELRFVMDLMPQEIIEVLDLRVAPNTLSQRIVRLVHRLRDEITPP